MDKYVAPEFKMEAFNCPNCKAYAHQLWSEGVIVHIPNRSNYVLNNFYLVQCVMCESHSHWIGSTMIYPNAQTAPMAVKDMPENILHDYNEARDVLEKSPKASAALLRLVIQNLCIELGEPGNHINTDIASLVEKGLPTKIQKALDVVRVVGNNAVHPGKINIDDNPNIALSLFKLTNLIVETMITQPKEIDDLFENLPKGAKEAIARRDS